MAMLAYLLMAAVLGLGILQTVHGKPWLLILGGVTYIVALGVLGCLPKKAH
jgi:hypothetical protein